jgi:hypothetical protein
MKRNVLLVLAAVAVLAIGSAAIASNMGFKISISLTTTGDGNNFISIPYYWTPPTWGSDPSPGSATASDLIYDINSAATNTLLKKYDPTTGSYTSRAKTALGWSGTDFAILPGVGYVAKVPSAVDYICVGSHNPSLVITLSTAGDGNNLVSIPYHFTPKTWTITDPSPSSITASDIIWDVNSAATNTLCKRYDSSTGSFVARAKTALGWSGTDFSMKAGEAYVIKVPSTVDWTPSHY